MQIRDSALIAEFISRLERELDEGVAWDELKVAHEIDSLRKYVNVKAYYTVLARSLRPPFSWS